MAAKRREDLIADLDMLFQHHKRGTSIDDDYETDIYDFLVEEELIVLTKQEKWNIFAVAKAKWIEELKFTLTKARYRRYWKTNKAILLRLENNRPAPSQMAKLQKDCKVMILKQFLDEVEGFEFE